MKTLPSVFLLKSLGMASHGTLGVKVIILDNKYNGLAQKLKKFNTKKVKSVDAHKACPF